MEDKVRWVFCKYHNQVISKYDCFTKSFFCLCDWNLLLVLFNNLTLLILCGVIKDEKQKVYFTFCDIRKELDCIYFFNAVDWLNVIEFKFEGLEPTLLEWKSNVLTVRR